MKAFLLSVPGSLLCPWRIFSPRGDFFPLRPLYFHADLSCFSSLTHLFIFLLHGCCQVPCTSSCLSHFYMYLWPVFFLHLHTHKYILVSCIVMLYIQNLSKHCKEFLFLGLLIWTSFLFSLFVPWVLFEFKLIFCVSKFSWDLPVYIWCILFVSIWKQLFIIIVTFPYSLGSPAICRYQKF